MFKITFIIFCSLSLYSVESVNILSALLSTDGTRPTRVRTLEEVKKSNGTAILDFIGRIEQYEGYTAEEYKVTTDDGYILALHRITGSPQSPKADNKPVVYIAHGLFTSSDFIVDFGPQKSIAFELADAGYDVWLGNVRGNVNSRAHVSLSPEGAKFWEYTLDEHALIDIPKFIDYALEKTGQQKLTYIGYSMGTTLSYMFLAGKPEYNEKINLLINLAPSVYFLKPQNWQLVNMLIRPLKTAAAIRKVKEVLPLTIEAASVGKKYCDSEGMNLCSLFFKAFATVEKMNLTTIPTIFAYAPAGTSYYVVNHYAQLIKNYGKLLKYDYGCRGLFMGCKNKNHYNSNEPPEYDITKVTVPNEAEYLKSKLSNVVVFEKVAEKTCNHMDFIWSTEAKSLVYDRVIKIMSEQLHKMPVKEIFQKIYKIDKRIKSFAKSSANITISKQSAWAGEI